MKHAIHINGKWLSQAITGTQRYADEMVRRLVEADRFDVVVHIPAGASAPDWMYRDRVELRTAPLKGALFEQVYLPLATAGALLLNFAGPAPLVKRRQLVTMHDAITFRHRHSYRRAFVAFYYVMYGVLGRTARQLATVSHFSASELADVLRIEASRFLVVHGAADALVDVAPERPALAVDHDHYLDDFYLMVGTQAQHKNLAEPVMAIAESGRSVVVVGVSGGQQVFSTARPLDDRAVIAGRMTDGELVWLYRNARALVFPSKYEGFGLPPIEAQMLGCPVVSSSAASLPEVCGDGASFFDPDDSESLIAALVAVESSPGLAEDLRTRGTANSQRFSWEASAAQVMEWLARTTQPNALRVQTAEIGTSSEAAS